MSFDKYAHGLCGKKPETFDNIHREFSILLFQLFVETIWLTGFFCQTLKLIAFDYLPLAQTLLVSAQEGA